MRPASLIDLITLRNTRGIWRESPGTAIVVTMAVVATIHAPILTLIWWAART
jgi:hypothetical protein